MRGQGSLFFGFIVACNLVGCSSKVDEQPLFRMVSPEQSGVDFSNDLKEEKLNIIDYLYYYNGGGVAVGDFDNDGLPDLYFTSNEGSNKLYHNKGGLKFEDITIRAGVAGTGDWTTGVTLVDINNDGLLDIYVCQVSGYKGTRGKNQLFVNNGDLTFTERSADYGLDFEGFSTQAVFFDYDQDGDLDMFLLNHSVHTFRSYGSAEMRLDVDTIAGDRLFKNLQNEGGSGFVDVTEEAGIFSTHIGYGLGVAVSDINLNGLPDLYISNDFHENDYLYLNNGDGTFTESLEKYLGHTSRYSMGNDVADINGDLLPDIITLDMLPDDPAILLKSAAEDMQEVHDIKKGFGYGPQYVRNTVQINQGDFFVDVARLSNIFATDWSWAPLICDLDNDGNSDVFITNGIYKRPNDLDYIQYTADMAHYQAQVKAPEDSVEQELIRRMPTLKISNYAFRYSGGYRFEDKTAQWGLSEPSYSSGAVYADLDNDGDLDLVTNNVNQGAFIFENTSERNPENHFIKIHLRARDNHFGIGAKVRVYTGGKVQSREMYLSRGFQSSVAPVLHFGLGAYDKADSIEVFWKMDRSQVMYEVAANQTLTIEEHEMLEQRPLHPFKPDKSAGLLRPVEDLISFTHRENDYKDYKRQPLIPYLMSREGPAMAIGDLNGDGLEDVFLGGARGQPGSIFIQTPKGAFELLEVPALQADSLYEDVDAIFLDFNGNGLTDIYVVSAGHQDLEGHPLLEDRVYINQGNGNFMRQLTGLKTNGSCVKAGGIGPDGEKLIFIGTRAVPGQYGVVPTSYILKIVDGGGIEIFQTLKPGMVTEAAWADIDQDGKPELIIAGDWMPITVYGLKDRKFTVREYKSLEDSHGWWRSLVVEDINGDGLPDIVAGNVGENLRLKPTSEGPVELYLGDFDDNGQVDPVIFYFLNGRKIPFHAKGLLIKQMPFLSKRFRTFKDFSGHDSPTDLFGANRISKAKIYKAGTFSTSLFINQGDGSFKLSPLPVEAQLSQVNDIVLRDFNGDGTIDIFLAGNSFANTVDLGRADGLSMGLLAQDRKAGFTFNELRENSNFNSQFQKAGIIHISGEAHLLIVRNNGKLAVYALPEVHF